MGMPARCAEVAWRRRFSDIQELSGSFSEECAALAQPVHSGLKAFHQTMAQRIEAHSASPRTTVPVIPPEAKPPSFALPLFGVYSGAGGGFLWSEKDAIE